MAEFADLFWMGAAFLLLESKNIVQFALFFGTTWYVNSLVFAGVLVSVYAAIETARHVKLPRPIWLYGALLVALAVSYVVPQGSLLSLPVVLRFLAATALAFAPVFLANLVFAQRFQQRGLLHHSLRRQPAGGDRRRSARVPVAHHRVPVPPRGGGVPLRSGLRLRPAPPHSRQLARRPAPAACGWRWHSY